MLTKSWRKLKNKPRISKIGKCEGEGNKKGKKPSRGSRSVTAEFAKQQ